MVPAAVAGGAVCAVGWLVAIPAVQYVALRRLRTKHPELFDSAAALAAVEAALRDT